MTLTFRLGDCVADFGLDVMLTVLGKDQGQAERTHTHTHIVNLIQKHLSMFVCNILFAIVLHARRGRQVFHRLTH